MLAFCHEKVMNTVKLMWFFEFKPKIFSKYFFGKRVKKLIMKLQYKILCVFTVILLSIIGCSDDRSLEEKFDDIELGMSYDEVRDIMGEPDDAYSTGTTWHYYISPTPSRTGDLLLILFIKGIVIQKQRLS